MLVSARSVQDGPSWLCTLEGVHLRLTVLLLVGACHRVFGLDVPADAGVGEDAPVDAVDASTTVTRWSAPVEERLALNFGDDDISFTSDRLILFMNRLDGPDSQIYTATRSSTADSFSPPEIVVELSAGGNQGTPRVMPSGRVILYHVDDALASSELQMATRGSTGAAWLPSGPLPVVNSPMADQNATMDATQTMLVFASDRMDGAGAMDLYYSSRATTSDEWEAPVPITKLNTPAIETGAWLTSNGLELYFQRDLGGHQDIYVSRRSSSTAPFELPEPVTEVNTPDYDIDPWISPDGQYLYFVRQSNTAMTTMLMYSTRQ